MNVAAEVLTLNRMYNGKILTASWTITKATPYAKAKELCIKSLDKMEKS